MLKRIFILSILFLASCEDKKENVQYKPQTGTYLPAHDVAKIVKDGSSYIVYYSGLESVHYDTENDVWVEGMGIGDIPSPLTGNNEPSWISSSVVADVGVKSAPGMLNSRTMYYCLADWDADDGSACIGRATATGTAPTDLVWVDDGEPVICSDAEGIQAGEPFAIDPAVFTDDDGNQWMVYGSHWSGIWVVELDATTGHLSTAAEAGWSSGNSAFTRVAQNLSEPSPEFAAGDIEAAFICNHDGYYYLFVNWGKCCNGVESTYNIRVGRSTSPTGPYFDKDGVSMDEGGGTLFMETEGRFIGPGHAGIYDHSEGSEAQYVFTFHFYDLNNDGVGTLGTRILTWGNDGWPELTQDIFSPSQ